MGRALSGGIPHGMVLQAVEPERALERFGAMPLFNPTRGCGLWEPKVLRHPGHPPTPAANFEFPTMIGIALIEAAGVASVVGFEAASIVGSIALSAGLL